MQILWLINNSPNSLGETMILNVKISENSRKRALKNHNEKRNIDRLISIYNQDLGVHREKNEQVRL